MPKREPTDAEVFVDKEAGPWAAQPLTLEGTARLTILIARLFDDMARKAQVEVILAEKENRPHIDKPLWAALVGVLGGDELQELLSIVTGKSPKWVKANYRLKDAARALREFFDAEDLESVLKNLMGTARPTMAGAVSDGSAEPLTDSLPSMEEV